MKMQYFESALAYETANEELNFICPLYIYSQSNVLLTIHNVVREIGNFVTLKGQRRNRCVKLHNEIERNDDHVIKLRKACL